jgi:hypothetical protein
MVIDVQHKVLPHHRKANQSNVASRVCHMSNPSLLPKTVSRLGYLSVFFAGVFLSCYRKSMKPA